jgi:hypothetical protein
VEAAAEVPAHPRAEQLAIVEYNNRETAKIDALITAAVTVMVNVRGLANRMAR